MRSFFVIVHEPRVASHVGGQYGRQPALDPGWSVLLHASVPFSFELYDTTAKMPTQADADFWHIASIGAWRKSSLSTRKHPALGVPSDDHLHHLSFRRIKYAGFWRPKVLQHGNGGPNVLPSHP